MSLSYAIVSDLPPVTDYELTKQPNILCLSSAFVGVGLADTVPVVVHSTFAAAGEVRRIGAVRSRRPVSRNYVNVSQDMAQNWVARSC